MAIISARWSRYLRTGFACLLTLALAGCESGESSLSREPGHLLTNGPTVDPRSIQTYQADIVMTAEWVKTLTLAPTSAQPEITGTALPIGIGTPLADRRGECLVSPDNTVQSRQGFCLSAPNSWAILNIDGGLAASLNTTPGQAISLQPDWASVASTCQILVYVAQESSIADHLLTRYDEMRARSDLVTLSMIGAQLLGDVSITGYVWQDNSGGRGGVYATMLGANRLAHISEGGSNCPFEQMLPVLDTIRFN